MLVAFDFETEAIEDFPNYPPKPVGLSLYIEGQQPEYYAFGHPSENNSTEDAARQALSALWNDASVELVAHNNPFDNLVAHKHWSLPLVPKATLHDTMVMCFLLDPHAKELGLKPQAASHLGLPPEERDAVKDWLVANGVCRDSKAKWGAHISKAPGALVGRYANGDTLRTLELYRVIRPKLEALGMWPAYQREMALQPIMLQNTVEGINVNAEKLAVDIAMYDAALAKLDQRIYVLLDAEPFNIDSAVKLADMIDRKIPGIDWPKTPTGKRSTSKATMELVLGGLAGELLACLQYRASAQTCVNTFMRTWLRQATEGDGRIHCQWHTTRSDDGGARTGRLSSSPNFQNIPTLKSAKFGEALRLWEEWLKAQDYPALPNVREYIIADSEDHVLLDRDFSGQELRVLAHYEDGDLLQAYKKDPTQDLHQWACDTIKELTGIVISRKQAKTVAFAVLYGSGLKTLAAQMGSDLEEAQTIKSAYFEAIPGIAALSAQLKQRAARGEAIKTFGGRLYHVEPPRYDPLERRWRTFDYKLLNVLIQGSSADITKDAVIAYNRQKKHGRLLLTVHDEIVLCVPRQHAVSEMAILKQCMESIPLDVQLLSDGKIGQDLHRLKDYNE